MTDSSCIRCKFFRMQDSAKGICRVLPRKTDGLPAARPEVATTHSCEKWQDCGQQYYIRLGWIKGQKEKTEKS